MYADRNAVAKTNPVGLTAAVAINAALVAALMLSAPEIAEHFDPPITAYAVPDDPPPPPQPETPTKPESKLPREAKIEAPIPEVRPLPSDPWARTTAEPQPPSPADPGPTQPDTGVTVDPPRPAPVLVDASPDPRAEFQPAYPPAERRAGVEGNVTVRVLIGTDGRVKAVEQVRSVSDAFFAVTKRQALSRWRFKPATRDGVPNESWRTITVHFVLEE